MKSRKELPMVTYKNITFKTKTGKSVTRRVKVLASGQYQFIKKRRNKKVKAPESPIEKPKEKEAGTPNSVEYPFQTVEKVRWKGRRKAVTRRDTGFPLSEREITVLKAVQDCTGRRFENIKVRDIMRASLRVYPETYRIALNESDVLDCIANLKKDNYIQGYGHLSFERQAFVLSDLGKDMLTKVDQMTPNNSPPLEVGRGETRFRYKLFESEKKPFAPRSQFRMTSTRLRARGHRRGVQQVYDPGNLTREDIAVLKVISQLKNKRRMSKVLFNDVWRVGQRESTFITEGNLMPILSSLTGRGYIDWVGHYVLTDNGRMAVGSESEYIRGS